MMFLAFVGIVAAAYIVGDILAAAWALMTQDHEEHF